MAAVTDSRYRGGAGSAVVTSGSNSWPDLSTDVYWSSPFTNLGEPHPVSASSFDLPNPPAVRGPLYGSLCSKRQRFVRDAPKTNRTISANASAENLLFQSAPDAGALARSICKDGGCLGRIGSFTGVPASATSQLADSRGGHLYRAFGGYR